jgi:hypothetical protein
LLARLDVNAAAVAAAEPGPAHDWVAFTAFVEAGTVVGVVVRAAATVPSVWTTRPPEQVAAPATEAMR